MYRKWITNADRAQARELREEMGSNSGNVCLIDRPSANGPWSVAELEVMNLVGIYMEVPDSEVKPNPDCPDCKGTGVITLFTSSSPCRCLSRFNKSDKKEEQTLGEEIVDGLRELSETVVTDKPLIAKFTVRTVDLKLEPRQYDALTVKETREQLEVSQAIFAEILAVSNDDEEYDDVEYNGYWE